MVHQTFLYNKNSRSSPNSQQKATVAVVLAVLVIIENDEKYSFNNFNDIDKLFDTGSVCL
jgi:hypothetical protein